MRGAPQRVRTRPKRARAKVVVRRMPFGRVVFRRSGAWWAVELPSFPGAYSQGKTLESAYRNLLGALRDLVQVYLDEARG